MKTSTHNRLVVFVTILCLLLLLGAIFLGATSESSKRKTICEKIGNKKGLELYDSSYGKCGWGIECSFQCKFINKEGEIIIKNVD